MDTTKCLAYFLNHYLAAAGTTTSSLRVISVNITNIPVILLQRYPILITTA